MGTNGRTAGRRLLCGAGALFLLSGASSLVYEIAWVKILTLQLGSSAWSISAVIASFMAGLGAGSAWAGRVAERIRRPLLAYGFLEIAIALFGLISVPLLSSMGGAFGALYSALEGHFGWFICVRFLLSFIVLLVPTFLMGASLPVLVVGLAGDDTFQKRIGLFYGINTLGGAVGVFVGGIFVLPAVGISGTVIVAVTLGALVGVGAILLDRVATPREVPDRGVEVATEPLPSGRPPVFLAVAMAIAGCVGIVYQIAWTRLLIPVVGSSTYAFSIILTTFLVGIGLGGLLVATPFARRRSYVGACGVMLTVTTLSALVGLFALNQLPSLFLLLLDVMGDSTGWLFFAQALLAGSIILVPTCAMGATLPLGIAGWRAETGARGTAVGFVYASNTLGSIIGSVVAGFVLLPTIGAAGAIQLAALGGALTAVALLFLDKSANPRARLAWSFGFTFVLGYLMVGSPAVDFEKLNRGIFRSVQAESAQRDTEQDVFYFQEGVNATVMVLRNTDSTVLKINGKADASTTGDLHTQYLIGHLPAFLCERPERVCVIGYGSGATVYTASLHPTVESIDVVEIEEAVMDASKFFRSINHDILEDPRVRVHLEDGRTFLRYRPKKYDVIVSEPSNPWIVGVSSLFTAEFYREVKARLRPGGRFCQWIQFYEVSNETLGAMLSTLADEFAHVFVFYVKNDLVCVASNDPMGGDLERFEERMAVPSLRKSLERIDIHTPYELFMSLFAVLPEDRPLFASDVRNTDDNLWLEYRAPIEMYRGARPSLKWSTPSRYVASLQLLFPGVELATAVRHAAAGLARNVPGLWFFLNSLAEHFAENEDLRGELIAHSRRAGEIWNEMQENPDRTKKAGALFLSGRFQDARSILELVVRSEPDDGPAQRLLGEVLLRLGERDEAREAFQRAIDIQPDDFASHRRLGELVVDEAERGRHLEIALELHPRFAPHWRLSIERLVGIGEPEAARAALDDAARHLTPSDFEWLEEAVGPLVGQP